MDSLSDQDFFILMKAICAGERARARVFWDELECKAFVGGADNDQRVNLCREVMVGPDIDPVTVLSALDECCFRPREMITLLSLGIAARTLPLPDAAKRLAGFFPGHDLQEEERYIVELAYQLNHDRLDGLTDSFSELESQASRYSPE